MEQKVKVSFIIPVFNEEYHLPRCLESISNQDFPKDKMEVIIADGGSEDGTVSLAKRWGDKQAIDLRMVDNPRRIAEFGKAEALKIARGEFFILLDADNRLCDREWLNKGLKGLELFPEAFGFESCYLPVPDGTALNNYLTTCLHISDTIAWGAASWPVEEKSLNEASLKYRLYKVPPGYPCGANGFIYRRSIVEPYINLETFEEAVVPMELAADSDAHIVSADGVGVQHYYVTTIRDYVKKRQKIAVKSHTRQQERKTWISYTGGRICLAAFLQITIVWPLVYSLWKAARTRSILWLLHAPVCFLTSVVYLINWARIKLRKEKAW